MLEPVAFDEPGVVFLPMLTTSRAVDLYLVDFVNKSRSRNGRSADSYRRLLDKFSDYIRVTRGDCDVTAITADDCRSFLGLFSTKAAGTRATYYSQLNSLLEWLYLQQRVKKNPLDHIPRPRRIAPEDLDVTTISTVDVGRLLAACRNHTEILSIAIPAYMGPRRNAVACLRLRDYDQAGQMMSFSEKGTKEIRKPVPYELATLIEAAIVPGTGPQHLRKTVWLPEDYLIPPEGALSRVGVRDDRVVWRVVKKVADRVGIDAHVHALRAAFATFYLEQPGNTGDLEGLRALLGHAALSTTQVYLRKLDRGQAMEAVRTLSWASVEVPSMPGELQAEIAGKRFTSSAGMGAGGFEPPKREAVVAATSGRQRSGEGA